MNPPNSTTRGDFQILTGVGPAAIAILRVRGAGVERFLSLHLRSHPSRRSGPWRAGQVRRADLLDEDGAAVDDILVSLHSGGPRWDLRLHLHGSPGIVRHCAALLERARFVERAEESSTLWPSADALEAEAYALLPGMLTLRGARWLLRQVGLLREALRELADAGPGERSRAACGEMLGRRGIVDWFARPLRVAVVGPPNAGKSTLVNALADRPVSLVSATPGTTRDWVEAAGEAKGFPVAWLDTAGLRTAAGGLEAAGIERTRRVVAAADAVLVVLDAASDANAAREEFLSAWGGFQPAAVALNKSDLGPPTESSRAALPTSWQTRATATSATEQSNLGALVNLLLESSGRDERELEEPAPFTPHQVLHLEAALEENDRKLFCDSVLRCRSLKESD